MIDFDALEKLILEILLTSEKEWVHSSDIFEHFQSIDEYSSEGELTTRIGTCVKNLEEKGLIEVRDKMGGRVTFQEGEFRSSIPFSPTSFEARITKLGRSTFFSYGNPPIAVMKREILRLLNMQLNKTCDIEDIARHILTLQGIKVGRTSEQVAQSINRAEFNEIEYKSMLDYIELCCGELEKENSITMTEGYIDGYKVRILKRIRKKH